MQIYSRHQSPNKIHSQNDVEKTIKSIVDKCPLHIIKYIADIILNQEIPFDIGHYPPLAFHELAEIFHGQILPDVKICNCQLKGYPYGYEDVM